MTDWVQRWEAMKAERDYWREAYDDACQWASEYEEQRNEARRYARALLRLAKLADAAIFEDRGESIERYLDYWESLPAELQKVLHE